MQSGHFYFLSDQYFIDFPDPYLMQNKENIHGVFHSRPCFYAFQDEKSGIYWMIPISSQVTKFKAIYQHKIQRSGFCDTLAFGYVLGHEKAFLIQNMCPVTSKYISSEYIDNITNIPVRVNGAFEIQLLQKAKKVLALQRKGIKLIFPDVLYIESQLLKK